MTLKKKIIVAAVILFVIAQFFQPHKNQSGFDTVDQFLVDTQAPKDVKYLMEQACFDCHSNHTIYPWYNSITPVNYWLNGHVKEGKKHFNVSKWASYSIQKKAHKLEELIEEIEESSMPLASYTWTHSGAQLSPAQIQSVVDWATRARMNYIHTTEIN
jgi:hypothetical protein